MREYYQFVADPQETKLGAMTWLSAACAVVETLIIYKFSHGVWSHATMPAHIKLAWQIAVSIGVVVATGWFTMRELRRRARKKAL